MSGWAGSFRKISACMVLLAALGSVAQARVYLSQEEALKLAFPAPARFERRTLFLDENEAAGVEKEAGSRLPGRVFPYYVGRAEGKVTGYAYFDTHLVRTLPETVMVLLSPDGKIRKVELLSFSEPEDYLPKDAWLGQFPGRGLDADLRIRKGIRNLTGASLTAGAITSACRRVLALHRLTAKGSD
jgi:hypothetical protein